MRFEPGRFYEHEKFMDVCIEVLAQLGVLGDGPTTLRVRWINRGWVGEPFAIYGSGSDLVVIPRASGGVTSETKCSCPAASECGCLREAGWAECSPIRFMP